MPSIKSVINTFAIIALKISKICVGWSNLKARINLCYSSEWTTPSDNKVIWYKQLSVGYITCKTWYRLNQLYFIQYKYQVLPMKLHVLVLMASKKSENHVEGYKLETSASIWNLRSKTICFGTFVGHLQKIQSDLHNLHLIYQSIFASVATSSIVSLLSIENVESSLQVTHLNRLSKTQIERVKSSYEESESKKKIYCFLSAFFSLFLPLYFFSH